MSDKPVNPFIFVEYDKITDVIMWLPLNPAGNRYCLKFVVSLSSKDKEGNRRSFHSEYSYKNKSGETAYSIVRNYDFYYVLEARGNFKLSPMLYPSNVMILSMLLQNTIFGWFIGSKRIFGKDSNDKLIIKGKFNPVQFPINAGNFITFTPIVINFENGDAIEGVRLIINNVNNYIDLSIDQFMNFSYIIINTDMLNAAMNMLDYVKSRPYLVNYYDLNQNNRNGGNFFNN